MLMPSTATCKPIHEKPANPQAIVMFQQSGMKGN
jgi:hypothetical protein